MRLTAFALTRYGNFEAEHIAFDARPGTLNLVLAPNGGGKSVLRAAFCDLLFGIGGQSPMGFRYGYPGMRIMAHAIGPDGQPFSFGRRKGQGNTLIKADGSSLEPATIIRLLGRIDRSRLERLFALDTDRLRRGEADLLASDGELGPALVSGAGGTHDLRAVRKSLEETRDSLAPLRRSAQRPFYVEVEKFAEARKRKEQSLLKPDQWQKLEQARAAAELRQAEQNQVVEAESQEIARLQRIRRVRPWLAQYDIAAGWLAAHPDAPVLDPNLSGRLDDAREQVVIVEQRWKRDHDIVVHLTEQLSLTGVNDTLLANADDIDRLVEATGAARKAALDLPAVMAQADARAALVAARLREVGSTLPVERAAEAIPPRAVINHTRRLIQAYATRLEAVHTTPPIAEREQACDAIQAQLAVESEARDVSDLEALAKEIRADGDPVRRQREVWTQRVEVGGQFASMLAKVPGWASDDAALVALSPLSPDAYERFVATVDETRSHAETHLEALQAARTARDAAHATLGGFTPLVPLADEAGLVRARERRDQGWRLIYRRAFTADPPSLHEEQSFAAPLPLPLAYERAVISADSLADRRIEDAATIERVQAARAALQEAEARVQEAETRHRLAAEAQQAAERAWRQLCSRLPLGEFPAIREVRAFLAARTDVIDMRQALLAAEAAETALAANHASWTLRLATCLGEPADRPLSDLLAMADKRIVEAQQAGRNRAALEARYDAASAALTDARNRQQHAVIALAEWREDWARAMAALGRLCDEDPQVTEDVLQVLAELDQAQKEHAGLAMRVSGMQRDIAHFTKEAVRMTPGRAADDPFTRVSALRLELQQARETVKQRDLLLEQVRDAAQAAALADRQAADRQAALRAILLLAGADTVEEAKVRLVLAADRARHVADLAAAEAELVKAGDSRSLAALREEAAAIPAEDIQQSVERSAQRRNEAQAAAQEAAATASALAQQMRQAADATGATDAAADQQAAVATIGRVLEDALAHHVAAEMLERALTAVERDTEPALLRRISALFSTLTNGVYARVLTEVGDDTLTRLSLVQRDFPDERQSVRDLSEGTRDQLYLALRLAAIEAHTAGAPALPFIGDDILQTFDDDRALAAMRVLGEISQSVQVILLTHHRHVLDLASRLPAGSVHVCRIGGNALVQAAALQAS